MLQLLVLLAELMCSHAFVMFNKGSFGNLAYEAAQGSLHCAGSDTVAEVAGGGGGCGQEARLPPRWEELFPDVRMHHTCITLPASCSSLQPCGVHRYADARHMRIPNPSQVEAHGRASHLWSRFMRPLYQVQEGPDVSWYCVVVLR